jgi:hypothetical protein
MGRPKLARKHAAEPADYQGTQRVTDSHEILGRSRTKTGNEERKTARLDCGDVLEPQDLTAFSRRPSVSEKSALSHWSLASRRAAKPTATNEIAPSILAMLYRGSRMMGSCPQGMPEQQVVTTADPSVVATSPTDNPVAQFQSPRSRRQKLHDADPNDYHTRYPSLS